MTRAIVIAAYMLSSVVYAQPYAYVVELGDWPAGTSTLHCYYNGKEAEARIEAEKGPARLLPVPAPLSRAEINRIWTLSKTISSPGVSQIEAFAALVRGAK